MSPVSPIFHIESTVNSWSHITLNGTLPTLSQHSQYSWQQVNTSTYYMLTRVKLEIMICVNTMYGYHYRASIRLRYQRFENLLEDEPWVGTLIRRSLLQSLQFYFKLQFNFTKNTRLWWATFIKFDWLTNAKNSLNVSWNGWLGSVLKCKSLSSNCWHSPGKSQCSQNESFRSINCFGQVLLIAVRINSI